MKRTFSMAQSNSGGLSRPSSSRPIIVPQPATSRRQISGQPLRQSTSTPPYPNSPARYAYMPTSNTQQKAPLRQKSSPLSAQPFSVTQRMTNAHRLHSSTSTRQVWAIANHQSLPQAQRYFEREIMGHDGGMTSQPPEWPIDYSIDRDDEKRLGVGMKWSAGRAKGKMWRFAERAIKATEKNLEVKEGRVDQKPKEASSVTSMAATANEVMLRNAIGDGVKLSSSAAYVKAESSTAMSKRSMLGTDAMDLDGPNDLAEGRQTPNSARSNRSILISESDEEDIKVMRRQKLKSTFINRRGVGKRRA